MNYINNMNYLDREDLVFYNNNEEGIHSGGFSVNSLLMKTGISPIVTLNKEPGSSAQYGGDKVSDIFNDLVVPNWAFYQPIKMTGGKHNVTSNSNNDNSDKDDEDDDTIDDNLHEELLNIVKHQESIKQKNNKLLTKKARKVTSVNKNKNNITKKTKINKNKQK